MISQEERKAQTEEIKKLTFASKESIVKILDEKFYNIQCPDVLYHYTGIEGFIGILKSASQRATDSVYLNDELELEFGKTMLLDELDKCLEAEPNYEDFKSETDELIKSTLETVFSPNRRTYIVSYCLAGDLLSQWRGYGSSAGISLGFKSSFFKSIVNENNSPTSTIQWNLKKVFYGEEAKDIASSLAKVIAFEVLNSIKYIDRHKNPESGITIIATPIIKSLALSLEEFCSIVKHDGFREENEYRLVGRESKLPEVKFRTSIDNLIPYIDLSFPKDFWIPDEIEYEEVDETEDDLEIPDGWEDFNVEKKRAVKYIDNLVVGPTANFQKQKSSIKEFLRNETHGEVFRGLKSSLSEDQEIFLTDEVLHQYRVDMYISLPEIKKSSTPLV